LAGLAAAKRCGFGTMMVYAVTDEAIEAIVE
jgi:hypothetical protein